MNILMLLDRDFPPDIRVQNEAISLINKGHVVHMLCYDFGSKPKQEIYKGIIVHRFRIHEQIAKKSLGLIFLIPIFELIWRREVFSILKKLNIEAVHIHDLPLCFLASKLKKMGLRVVTDMHENYPYMVAEQSYMNTIIGKIVFSKQLWLTKEKIWLNASDHIVCVASEMRSRLQKVVNPSIPIDIVPNTYSFSSHGAEQENLPELSRRFDARFVVTYIGGFDSERGIHLLIEAINLLKDQITGILLVLVGDGSNRIALEKLTKELGIQDLVIFEGWQPSKHVQAYINMSSVCVIPHIRSEQTDNSSPNKLFQYMYAYKPVISSNCVSLEKIILEEQCGLVFQDQNTADLAEKILQLSHNPDDCIVMGENGHQAVMLKYNWDITVEPLFEIYKS